ncbi:MAG: nucleotidyltransferase domain-containing protein [bacterium]
MDYLKDEKLKIVLFGSFARGENYSGSDIDIEIIPKEKISEKKIPLLRERIEDLNIPYKVEIVNLDETSMDFKNLALKDAIVWKD